MFLSWPKEDTETINNKTKIQLTILCNIVPIHFFSNFSFDYELSLPEHYIEVKLQFKKIFLPITFLFSLGLGWSCQQDEETLLSEPRIQMFFINETSLIQVEDTLVKVADSLIVLDSVMQYYSDSSGVLRDSLVQLAVLIEQGNDDLQPIFDEMQEERERVLAAFDATDDLDSIMNDSKKAWEGVEETITDGIVWVASITNRVNSRIVEYEDSSELWYLPVSMNHDTVYTSIELDGTFYDLDVAYERLISVNEFNNVIIETENISIIHDDFIRVELNCQDCKGRETKFTIYF